MSENNANPNLMQAIICSKCSSINQANASFCSNCEASLQNTSYSSIDKDFRKNSQSSLNPDVVSLIGSKQESYYINKFSEIDKSDYDVVWNWAAFIFSVFWGVYRKLYTQAIICTVVAASVFFAMPEIAIFIIPVVSVIWALFGTNWYREALKNKAAAAQKMSDKDKRKFMKENKGTLF